MKSSLLGFSLGLAIIFLVAVFSVYAQNTNIIRTEWRPTADEIAAGTISGEVLIIDANDGNVLATLIGHSDAIIDLDWRPTQEYLASASLDGTVRIWNTATWSLVTTLTGHEGGAWVVVWGGMGSGQLFTIAPDADLQGNNLYVWTVPGWQQTAAGGGTIGFAELSPNGDRIALGASAGGISLFDTTTLNVIEAVSTPDGYGVTALAWSPDGSTLASGSILGSVFVLDITNQTISDVLYANDKHDTRNRAEALVKDLQFDAAGTVLSSLSADGTVRSWDVTTSALIVDTRLDSVFNAGIGGSFSPDGVNVAYSGVGNAVEITATPLEDSDTGLREACPDDTTFTDLKLAHIEPLVVCD